ncbi:MAG: hypothetical protein KG003_00835 [Bacteroidetes bacterium]|nr:hypothetical protein [Bacteroidota bacterium]
MRTLALSLVLLVAGAVSAQDLVVQYDFIQDKFTYTRNQKTISKAVVRKNGEVQVQVKNLNPFVFIARCDWKEENVADNSSISGLASMFTGIPIGGEALGGILSGLNMDQFNLSSTRGDLSMFDKYATAKSDMKNAVTSFNKLFAVEQTLITSDFTTAKLKKLKLNPYLPYDTLKAITDLLIENVMAPSNSSEYKLTATSFLQKANDLNNTLHVEYDNLSMSVQNFLDAYNSFSNINGNNFSEAGMDQTMKSMLTAAGRLHARYTNEYIHKKIEELEQQYEAITYTPFVYMCNYMAQGDMLTLQLDFYETSPYTRSGEYFMGGDAIDTLRKIRTKIIHIGVQGDMKITTSVGIGFPTYFDKNQSYSNRDSLIYGTAGNNYAPCISTFLNFYPYAGKNVHWGGCFGVGIPVQSEGTSNLNFFLGGSALFGSSSKVGIHAGLAVGQLSLLTNGQKVGDNLGDDSTGPDTKKAFTTGGFFGISFALSK